jgi:hypothetical protein
MLILKSLDKKGTDKSKKMLFFNFCVGHSDTFCKLRSKMRTKGLKEMKTIIFTYFPFTLIITVGAVLKFFQLIPNWRQILRFLLPEVKF